MNTEVDLEIEKQFKGNVGIFLVAAKLSQMNLIALTTSRNTRGYDIVILDPLTNRGKGIQVKCSDQGSFPLLQTRLKEYEETADKKIVSDHVFVDISNVAQPKFFVVPRKRVRSILKKSIKNWIDTAQHRKPMPELMATEKKQNWALDLEEIERFENNWRVLLQDLQSEK